MASRLLTVNLVCKTSAQLQGVTMEETLEETGQTTREDWGLSWKEELMEGEATDVQFSAQAMVAFQACCR